MMGKFFYDENIKLHTEFVSFYLLYKILICIVCYIFYYNSKCSSVDLVRLTTIVLGLVSHSEPGTFWLYSNFSTN